MVRRLKSWQELMFGIGQRQDAPFYMSLVVAAQILPDSRNIKNLEDFDLMMCGGGEL